VKILVLASRHVRELLPYGECADLMRRALADLARGQIQQPLRTVVRPRDAAGFMGLMPSYSPDIGYGLKAICITPGNPAIGKDAHQGGVLLFDAATGEPLALVNASAVTEIRTAAVSAVATDLLARPGAAELAIIGTGVQGRAHAHALAATRPLTGIIPPASTSCDMIDTTSSGMICSLDWATADMSKPRMAEAINSAANGPRAALSKRGNMVQLDLLKAFESQRKGRFPGPPDWAVIEASCGRVACQRRARFCPAKSAS